MEGGREAGKEAGREGEMEGGTLISSRVGTMMTVLLIPESGKGLSYTIHIPSPHTNIYDFTLHSHI